MKTIEVEIPQRFEKSFSQKMTFLSFVKTLKTLDNVEWVDTKLDTPMKMTDFYNLLKKEL